MPACILIINKSNDLIRKCIDEDKFNSKYQERFAGIWYFVRIEDKTAAQWYKDNPISTIEVTAQDENKIITEMKWLNPADGEYYTLKERPEHDRKWLKVPGTCVCPFADNEKNTEEINDKPVLNIVG